MAYGLIRDYSGNRRQAFARAGDDAAKSAVGADGRPVYVAGGGIIKGGLPVSAVHGGNDADARAIGADSSGVLPPPATGGNGGGLRGFVGELGSTPALSPERMSLYKAAGRPYPGAQNGQLTARQLETMRGLLSDEQRDSADARQLAQQERVNAADNQAALQREMLQQQGALVRDSAARGIQAQQEDADRQERARQFDAAQALAARKNDLQTAEAELGLGLTRRKDELQRAYLSAGTDAQRAEIAAKIRALSGTEDAPQSKLSDNVIKIQRQVADAATGLPITQDDVVDLRTGKSILADGNNDGKPKPVGYSKGVPVYQDAQGRYYTM